MKLLFSSALFLFFSLNQFGSCSRIGSTNKFVFNDVERSKNEVDSASVFYPLIDDLSKDEDFNSNFVNTYDEISFPNPFIDPEECVLSLGISHSWLCDPEHYLSLDEQLVIEALLLKIRDTNFHKCSDGRPYFYQIGVAIVPHIVKNRDSSFEESMEKFSENLLRKWGIGNKECHDGILLVYIKQLGKFIVAKREGVESKYINETEIRRTFMNTYFATGSLGKALEDTLEFINTKLPSKPQELTVTAKVFLLLLALYIISIIILYFATTTYNKSL